MSGSGTKMYVFLGAILELHQRGYVFSEVTGTSGGSIVGALLAAHYDPASSHSERTKAIMMIAEMAQTVDIGKLRDRRWLAPLPWSDKARFKGNKILKKLREILPGDFSDLNMACTCVVLQMNCVTKRTVHIGHGDLPLAVRGSMSIPFAFDMVKIDDMLVVDGGWGGNFEVPAGGQDVVGLFIAEADSEAAIDIKNNARCRDLPHQDRARRLRLPHVQSEDRRGYAGRGTKRET
jgi:NTE family protein